MSLPFTVYILAGQEFDFFLDEQFRLIFRSMFIQLSSREVVLEDLAIH